MAEAELIISPEISQKALKKSNAQLNAGLKKSAEDAGKNYEKKVTDGLTKAGKKGSSGLAKNLKIGIAGVAALVAGALTAGIAIAGERASSSTSLMSGILGGERDASNLMSFANLQNAPIEKITAMQRRVLEAGGNEQDSRDLLVDTSEFIAQAKAGENQLLKNFVDIKGGTTSQFNAVLASLNEASTEERNKFLADIGWAGDSAIIARMMDKTKGLSGKDAYALLEKTDKEDRERAILIKKEAAQEKIYADYERKMNVEVKAAQLNAMTDENIRIMIDAKKTIELEKVNYLINYKENQRIAEETRLLKEKFDDAILAVTTGVAEFIIPWFKKSDPLSKKEVEERQISSRQYHMGDNSYKNHSPDYGKKT